PTNGALLVEVAERRRAEEAARERQRFVEGLAEANPSIIYLIDLRPDRRVWVNGRIASMLGYSPESFQGRTDPDLHSALLDRDDSTRSGIVPIARRFELGGDRGVREFECR